MYMYVNDKWVERTPGSVSSDEEDPGEHVGLAGGKKLPPPKGQAVNYGARGRTTKYKRPEPSYLTKELTCCSIPCFKIRLLRR
jgi:hypothetical protein